MRVINLVLVISIFLFLNSCAQRAYVTPNLLKTWVDDGINIEKLQYRNTIGFEWYQRSQKREVDVVKDGELAIKKENVTKKTYIKAKTECVLKSHSGDLSELYLSFDEDEEPFYFKSQRPNEIFYHEMNGVIKTRLYVLSTDVEKSRLEKKRLKGVRVQ